MTARRASVAIAAVFALASALQAQDLKLPNKEGTVKFALIGDTGTGSQAQTEVGTQMAAFRKRFPFAFVVMVGDNMYGSQRPQDFVSKFEAPYRELLAAGVPFYAALGNHDEPGQKNYKHFNMAGERFYAFRANPKEVGAKVDKGVRFYALDSNYMDKTQLDWIEKQLSAKDDDWKICFFHHPLYSSARKHGSALDLRKALEPLFVQYKVDVVLAGHEHVYERIKPQQGITYFVSGAGGTLRKGDLQKSSQYTAAGFDKDYHFMLFEIDGDELHFQAISRTGATVDSGSLKRQQPQTAARP
jgi:predicted MPP superfamily phosphohydrolase